MRVARPPGAGTGADHIERRSRFVVEPEELRIVGGVLEPLLLDKVQQENGIVIRETPERIVEIAEHVPRHSIPTPPQVVGELIEPANPRGERRQRHVPVHRLSILC